MECVLSHFCHSARACPPPARPRVPTSPPTPSRRRPPGGLSHDEPNLSHCHTRHLNCAAHQVLIANTSFRLYIAPYLDYLPMVSPWNRLLSERWRRCDIGSPHTVPLAREPAALTAPRTTRWGRAEAAARPHTSSTSRLVLAFAWWSDSSFLRVSAWLCLSPQTSTASSPR
jgi:hypothetical protein|eukprot:COSAG06_NODE_114_length_23375_cov_20.304219_1_plen_171_part_00